AGDRLARRRHAHAIGVLRAWPVQVAARDRHALGDAKARAVVARVEADEVPVPGAPAAGEVGQGGEGAVAKAAAPPGDEALVTPEAPALAQALGVDRLEARLARRVPGDDPRRLAARRVALGADARVVAARPARVGVTARAPGEDPRRARGRDEGEHGEHPGQ